MSIMSIEDLKVDIKVKGKVRNFDFNQELGISHNNPQLLNEEMSQQPSKYAWIGVLHALANDHYERLNTTLKTKYATLDKKHREKRNDEGLKVTEAVIASDIERDKEYIIAREELQNSKLNRDILSVAMAAFQQRKDMLISIGSNLRAERDMNLSIKKDKVKKLLNERREN